ncbi:MAG: hypothetical protein V3S98_09485 [Dehalococcoidia bacterium]
MSTKAAFIAAMGGALLPFGSKQTFVRSSGDILTATAHGLQTGAGPYKVMTNAADAPSGLVVARHALTFATLTTAIATDVLIVNGRTYTFVAAPDVADDVDITIVDAHDAQNMADAINREVDAAATNYDLDTPPNDDVRATVTTSGALGAVAVLTIIAKTLDAAIGNAITLTSPDGTIVVDAAVLENGVSGQDYFIIRLDDNTFSLATTKALALAGTAQALADAGTGIHELVPTVQTLADAMEDVVVNVLTATGVRTMDATFNIAKYWRSVVDGTSFDLT